MKKTRILSLLLAATLLSSSFTLTAVAESVSVSDSADISEITTDGWKANGKDSVKLNAQTINGEVPENYLRISSTSNGKIAAQLKYKATFTKGSTYRLTVWARRAPIVISGEEDALGGISVTLNSPTKAYKSLTKANTPTAWNDNEASFTLLFDEGGADNLTNADGLLTLSDKWTKYVMEFTVTKDGLTSNDYGICFIDDGTSTHPFEIGGISLGLVDTATGVQTSEMISDNMLAASNWKARTESSNKYSTSLKFESCTDESVMRAPMASANTSITYTPDADIYLEPGVYTVSGDFKIGVFSDYTKISSTTAIISGSVNGSAASTATVGSTWKTFRYDYEVKESVKLNELAFSLNAKYALDYRNIKVEKSAKFTADWKASDNSALVAAEDINYINFANRVNNRSRAVYVQPGTLEAGTYTMSFRARTLYTENYNVSGVTDEAIRKFRIYRGTEGSSKQILSSSVSIEPGWTNIKFNFSVTEANAEFKFYICGTSNGYGFAPIDITDFSVVKAGDTTNLITNPFGLKNDSTAGWYGEISAVVTEHSDGEYVPVSENVSIISQDTATLSTGRYYVSGEFRLDSIDYSKIPGFTADKYDSANDGNKDIINAAVSSGKLNTVSGNTAEIGTGWTTQTFILDVLSPTTLKELEFTLGAKNGMGFSFKNLKIEKAAELITEWKSSNGTALVAADDVEYINFANRLQNRSRAIYEQNGIFEPGTYTMSFRVRTLDTEPYTDGDVTDQLIRKIRIYQGREGKDETGNNLSKQILASSAAIGSDWTNIKFNFEITEANYEINPEIRFYITGTSYGYGFAPIDIADFSVVKVGEAVNLITNPYGLKNDGEAGWFGEIAASLTYHSAGEYVPVPENISIISQDTTTLNTGRYYISGEFRLDSIDYSKISGFTVDKYDTANDGNKDIINATVSFGMLSTLDGSAAEIGTGWTTQTFILDLLSPTTLKELEFTLGTKDGASFHFKNLSWKNIGVFLDGWTTNDGKPVHIIDESADESASADTEIFIRVASGKPDTGATYNDPTKSLAYDKTYKMSFKARVENHANIAGIPGEDYSDNYPDMRIRLFGNGKSYTFTQLGAVSAGKNPELFQYTGKGSEVINGHHAIHLYEEWNEYTFIFSPAKHDDITADITNGIKFDFIRFWCTEDVLGFDIAALSIVEVDPETYEEIGEELITDPTANWSGMKSDISVAENEVYYRIEPSESGENTELNCSDSGVFEPGTYEIISSFRLSTYDFNTSNTTNVSAMVNGIPLKTKGGYDSVGFSTTWTNAVFVLETKIPVDMSDIVFVFDGAYMIDMKDVSYVQTGRYVSIGDVNTGIIVTLLALKLKQMEEFGFDAPWSAGGKELTVVNSVLDESIGKTGAEDGAAVNSYIHVSGRDHNEDRLIYANNDAVLKAGTYTLTFWARSTGVVNTNINIANGRNPVNVVRLFVGDGKKQVSQISVKKSGSFDSYISHQLSLPSEWGKYSYTFKIDNEQPFKFWFRGNSSGYGVIPFDIDGFTLMMVDPTTYVPLNGTNLAVKSDKLMGSGTAGWYVENVGSDVLSLDALNVVESKYMTATYSGGNEIVVSNTGGRLEPGKYYVTAKVRLNKIDYAKYEYASADGLSVDNNKAELTAYLGGTQLKTTKGADRVNVTSEWTTVSFALDVTEKTSLKKLKLVFNTDTAIDFDFINIDTVVNTLDRDAVVDGETPTLPPLEVAEGGDLLDGAISEERLGYWFFGDQKLEAKVGNDGEVYFAASNITNNMLGFTYAPGFEIRPGTYKFSGYIRTSNKGEKGMVRIMIDELFASSNITDEWKLIELVFTVTDTLEFSLKLRGGPISTSTHDYEFKGLSLVDINYIPANVNLYPAGDFENEVQILSEWKMGYGTGKFTINTEDGNSYLTVSDRGKPENSDYPAIVAPGFTTTPGDTYTISFDIRTSIEGETMHARTLVGNLSDGTLLNVDKYVNGKTYLYEITHEWRHIVHTFRASTAEEFVLQIKGGPRGEPDNKSFDIDNLTIVKKGESRILPDANGQLYTFGTFDSKSNSIIGWKMADGTGKITWNTDETNSYLTVSERGSAEDSVQLSTGCETVSEAAYKVSFDIRTSTMGETMSATTLVGNTSLNVNDSNAASYAITNEWTHIEHTYTASVAEEFVLRIKGATSEDDKNFDLDNVKIEIAV